MLGSLLRRIRAALLGLRDELRGPEAVALLLVTLVLVTRDAVATPGARDALAPLWQAVARLHPLLGDPALIGQLEAVFLQLGLPLLAICLVHRRRLAEFGLGGGDVRFWLPILLAVLLVQVPVVALFLARDPTYLARYPSLPLARQGGAPFALWEGSRVLYMISWEFLFRGYLLFALAPRLGRLACMVQTVPFTLMHIVSRKPLSEIYFTIISGLLSGLLALEGRSIWPVVLLHAVGAVLLDTFIVFGG